MKKILTFTKENFALITILFTASFLRLFLLGEYPRGTYTDEAYGAYIAYGLLTGGIDDRGYSYPVYFIAWGSGMNALYSYLGMLFFRLFGVSLTVYRLPQALFGILGIGSLYVICRELFSKKAALFSAFVLAVNPWHIMACRFGLESNLAPNMFLIGLMFLILGLHRKNKYLVPSAVFFGLTLYCYALTWLILPVFFLLLLLLCWKWIPRTKASWFFVLILFIMALPLLLFLGVNYDWIPEIRTPFLSIPKLTGFRSGELSPSNVKNSFQDILNILLVRQGDGEELLSSFLTGAYYFFTTPFMLYGVAAHICSLVRSYKNGRNNLSIVFPVWLASAGLMSILHNLPTMIHINMLHIPVIFYGAYGIYQLGMLLKSKLLFCSCAVFYGISLLFFAHSYTEMPFAHFFDDKPWEATKRAEEIADGNCPVTFFGYSTYKFPNLLWMEKCDISDYSQTAVYNGDPFFADLLNYKNYHYITDTSYDEVTTDGVYVIYAEKIPDFHTLGFEIEQVNDKYAVAAMKIPSLKDAEE